MSLINKMLTDLETRKDLPPGARITKPIFADLRPATRARGRSHRVLLSALVLAGLAVAVFFAWQQWGEAWRADLQALQNRIAGAEPKAHTLPVVEVAVAPQPVATTPAVKAQPVEPEAVEPKVTEPKPAAPKPKPRAAKRALASEDQTSFEKTARPWTAQEQAENRYRKAMGYLKQKQRNEAEAELQAALSADPRHTPTRELLVGLLLENGRSDAAQRLLEQGLSAVPSHTVFAQLLARLYVEQGADAQAVTLLEKYRSSSERNPEFMALLATLYHRAGRHADSAAAYRQALSARPQEGKWWAGLGISLEAEKQWRPAYEAYTRAQAAGLPPAVDRYVEQRLAALKGRGQ